MLTSDACLLTLRKMNSRHSAASRCSLTMKGYIIFNWINFIKAFHSVYHWCDFLIDCALLLDSYLLLSNLPFSIPNVSVIVFVPHVVFFSSVKVFFSCRSVSDVGSNLYAERSQWYLFNYIKLFTVWFNMLTAGVW